MDEFNLAEYVDCAKCGADMLDVCETCGWQGEEEEDA